MDINQMVSAIRYMIAQRAALVDMEEVLVKVQSAEALVEQATKDATAIRTQITQDSADAARAQMVAQAQLDATQAKLEALQGQVQATRQAQQETLATHQQTTQDQAGVLSAFQVESAKATAQLDEMKGNIERASVDLACMKKEIEKRQAILDQLRG